MRDVMVANAAALMIDPIVSGWPLSIGSLFSGIGGLELGLERAGLGRVAWQVEQDEFCRRVLAKHWPDADRGVTDVRTAGASTLVSVDVICGGFPCQDVSGAGRGAGLDGARSGLWWEFRRVVDELRPRVVIVENVASGARRWLCAVRGSLQELGYRTRAFGVAARDVGAPHRRERIFVVAYTNCVRGVQPEGSEPDERRRSAYGGAPRSRSDVADAHGAGLEVRQGQRGDARPERQTTERDRGADWISKSGLGRDAHGLPSGLDGDRWPAARGQAQHSWEPPRTVNYQVPKRSARLRALGNAVVPQCAEVVGRVVMHDLGLVAVAP